MSKERRFDFKKANEKVTPTEDTILNKENSLEDINKSIKTGQVLEESMFAPVYSSEDTSTTKKPIRDRKKFGRNRETINQENLSYEELGGKTPENTVIKGQPTSKKPKLTRSQIAKKYGNREINKHRVSFFDVMAENFFNKLTKGNLDVQKSSFEIAYNRIMSERHTKMIFQIIELPMEGVHPGYVEDIREKLKERFTSGERNLVDVFNIEFTRNNAQNLSSRKNKSTESSLEKQYSAFEEELKVMRNPQLGFSEAIQEEAKSDRLLWSSMEAAKSSREEISYVEQQMKKIVRKQKTFNVIQKFQASGGHCCDSFLFIEVIVKKPELLELAAIYMREILDSLKMEYKEILDLGNYQKAFGVASLNVPDKKSKLDVIPFLTTSNVSAITTNFKPGIIRDKVCEIYMGNQVLNNYRFDIGVTSTGKAENYLLIAQTGAGKTGFIATSLLTAMDNPYISIIIKDFKGGEYGPFANVFPEHATVISTGIDTGSYINTYIIPDYKKFGFDKPITSFLLASNITIKTLTALATRKPETEQPVQDVCTDIVDKVYRIVGVRQKEPSTYGNSLNIDYPKHTMYALKELMKDSDVRSKYSTDILDSVHTALVPHFGYEGVKGGMYQKAVDLEKILFNNRIIICDKGAQTVGGSQTMGENELRAQFLQELYIDNLFSAINRMKGFTTIIVTEEIQRRLKDKLVLDELVNLFTGGRSNNIVNIGICSSVNAVFNSGIPEMEAIRESVNGLIIGKCDSSVVDVLIESTGISNIKDSLMQVSKGKGIYEFSFLFYSLTNKTDAVVTRMPINQRFLDSLLKNKVIRKSEYNFEH